MKHSGSFQHLIGSTDDTCRISYTATGYSIALQHDVFHLSADDFSTLARMMSHPCGRFHVLSQLVLHRERFKEAPLRIWLLTSTEKQYAAFQDAVTETLLMEEVRRILG